MLFHVSLYMHLNLDSRTRLTQTDRHLYQEVYRSKRFGNDVRWYHMCYLLPRRILSRSWHWKYILKFYWKFSDIENTNLCTIFQKESKISTIPLTKVVSLLRANHLKIDNFYGGTLSDKNSMYSLLKYDVETNICYWDLL